MVGSPERRLEAGGRAIGESAPRELREGGEADRIGLGLRYPHLRIDGQGLLHQAPAELDVADREVAVVDGLAQGQGAGQRPRLVPQHLQVVVQAEPVAPDP